MAQLARVVSGQEKLPDVITDKITQELDERDLEPGANIKTILRLFQESHVRLEHRIDELGGSRPKMSSGKSLTEPSVGFGTNFHCYDGGLHVVPKDFRFPSMTLELMIHNWLLPQVSNNIPRNEMSNYWPVFDRF